MIQNFIKNELKYLEKLSPKSKSLLLSYFVFSCVGPLLFIFSNAYIWNSTNNAVSLALYNIGLSLGLSITFYINGYLLKKLQINFLYALSFVVSGISPIILVFINNLNQEKILLIGLIAGISNGLYWANRNLLELRTTIDTERNYFSGLALSIDTLMNVIIPFAFGLLIELLKVNRILSYQDSYKLIVVIISVILFAGFIYIIRSSFTVETPGEIFVFKISKLWWSSRLLKFTQGLLDGILLFFSTLIILYLIGSEGILGTLQSASAILTSIVLYIIGKRSSAESRIKILGLGALITAITSVLFSIIFGSIGTLQYVLLQGVGIYIMWMAANPLSLQSIEIDQKNDLSKSYFYICDNELFLNIGRITGIGMFIWIYQNTSFESTLRLTTLLSAVFVSLFYISARILKHSINKSLTK
jgi:YQGE family putative transporter